VHHSTYLDAICWLEEMVLKVLSL